MTCIHRSLLPLALALSSAAIPCSTAWAQRTAESFLYAEDHSHALRLRVEMDPALAIGVGYLGVVDLDVDDFHRRIGIRAETSATINFSSWDFTFGAAMLLAEGAGFNALFSADLELKVAQNELHTALVYGYGFGIHPGYYDPVWYLAAELSVRGSFAATLFHSDAYRQVFDGVEDGTYRSDHLNLFVGGALGFRIEEVVLIGLRFAWRFPRTFESYAPYVQPYTIGLEVGARFE